ncbi:MAG: alpha/beta fold hydrolase [Xanthobacteraceae bacterium]
MATILVAHGAWSAGWAWKKMRPLVRATGHELLTPTYTGLGERAHLANPAIDLETHIHDVLGVLEFEDLRDVVLLGHSYGGMVATGVADRARDRLAKLIYLDAFVPQDGQSLFDLLPAQARRAMTERARESGEGWRVPANPLPSDTSAADTAWIMARRLPQPIKTFESKLRLTASAPPLERNYIYCRRSEPGDVFRQFAERAKGSPDWRYREIDASHSPNVTAPETLAALLHDIVSVRAVP